jgi:hypothetical protein
MKIHSLVALVGLAMGSALPTFAQQTNPPDSQLRDQLVAFDKKFDEAFNNNDAAAVAASSPRMRFSSRTEDQSTVGRQSRNASPTGSRMYTSATTSRQTIRIPLTLRVRPAMRCGRQENGVTSFKLRTAILSRPMDTGQRLKFVTAMFGRCG